MYKRRDAYIYETEGTAKDLKCDMRPGLDADTAYTIGDRYYTATAAARIPLVMVRAGHQFPTLNVDNISHYGRCTGQRLSESPN